MAAFESWPSCDWLFFNAGSVDLCGNNKTNRLCVFLTWHFYALINWVGAACSSEVTPRANVAQYHCGSEFKVLCYGFTFHPPDYNEDSCGLVSGRKRSRANTSRTYPNYERKTFSMSRPMAVIFRSIRKGRDCWLAKNLRLSIHNFFPP